MAKLASLLFFLLSFLIIEVINTFLARSLNQFGLIPRSFDALQGILLSPWLHANTHHFLANITALLVLSPITWQWGKKTYWTTTLFIIITSGLLVWIFARPAFHIGASGLVYGYFGFCLIAGFINRKPIFILLSIFVGIFYGSMIWGVLPLYPGTSFEYHLFGFIMGLLAAKIWAKK